MKDRFSHPRLGMAIGRRNILVLGLSLYSLTLSLSWKLYGAPGTFTTFDVPGARNTYPTSLNSAGTITGYYVTLTDAVENHGFLRAVDGSIVTFDVPGARSTFPLSINSGGAITGFF